MKRIGPSQPWPTDNDLGIPVLRIDRQGDLFLPVRTWGNVGRGVSHKGTYSLYCDDYRFQGLMQQPDRILPSGCAAAIEPNISVFHDQPLAWAVWATYEKRRVARTWQELGVPVIVDLCVPEQFYDVNLLGVPRGWLRYATRGFCSRVADVERDHGVAVAHGGAGAIIYVIGGGSAVKEECKRLSNAVYIEPEAPTDRKGKRLPAHEAESK